MVFCNDVNVDIVKIRDGVRKAAGAKHRANFVACCANAAFVFIVLFCRYKARVGG